MALTPVLSAGLDLCPTQEMRENSCSGTSAAGTSRVSQGFGQSWSCPGAQGQLCESSTVSAQPGRRNCCDKGRERSACSGLQLDIGFTWPRWHSQGRHWSVPGATHAVPKCTRTAPSNRSTAQRAGEGSAASQCCWTTGGARRGGTPGAFPALTQPQRLLTLKDFSLSLSKSRGGVVVFSGNPEGILKAGSRRRSTMPQENCKEQEWNCENPESNSRQTQEIH